MTVTLKVTVTYIKLLAALLAGALGALVFSGALAAPRAAFLHIATNLSNRPARYSYYADIAVSPDGDRVVAVWSEAYQDYGGATKGSVYLRWASESTGSGWSAPVTVHAGDSNECARWATVAVTGTNPYTAVVAYIIQSPCDSPTFQAIRYRLCTLGGACGAVHTAVSVNPSPGDPGYGSVDIALDNSGVPHLVYAYYQRVSGKDVGTVYYWFPNIGSPEQVSQSGYDARTPAIAWNGGVVHVVWATEPWGTNNDYFIFYRRRTTSGWVGQQGLVKQSLGYAPHNPAIAVLSNTVLVAWDMNNAWTDTDCQSEQRDCEKYTLAYIRSTDNGQSWPSYSGTPKWYELGGDYWGTERPYTSTGAVVEYTRFLRPSVGFRANGKPVVVWHVNDGTTDNPDYNIYYTEALTVPESAADPIEWAEVRRFGQNAPLHSASPVVAPFLPGDALHVVYLQYLQQGMGVEDWETYYDGNEYDRYSHVYLPIVMRNAH
ncbi:MAG: hypothetical protein H5T61_03000 [Thermoflexales bacterium]|nr:hypothetical protein [Thermoflexales bacterium]